MNEAVVILVLGLLAALVYPQAIRNGAYTELRYAVAIAYNSTVELSLPEQQRCPNTTGHVLFQVQPYSLNGPGITRDMGCCPTDYYGCWDDDVNQLVGCCPPDNSICCVGTTGQFVGCAIQEGQCCADTICPVGYGCCSFVPVQQYPEYYDANRTGTLCCPTDPAAGDADAKDLYCEVLTVNDDPSDPASFPRSYPAGCLHSYEITLDYCPVETVNCNVSLTTQGDNSTACLFCGNNTANCSVVYPIKCANLSDCRTFEFVPGEELANATGMSTINITGGCCPGNQTLCVNPVFFNQVGCADTDLGYSCCGPFICPPLTKCCTTIGYLNQTNYLGCCPNPLDCCIKNVADPTATPDSTNFFCGASFNGTSCEVNKFAESQWFTVTQPEFFV